MTGRIHASPDNDDDDEEEEEEEEEEEQKVGASAELSRKPENHKNLSLSAYL